MNSPIISDKRTRAYFTRDIFLGKKKLKNTNSLKDTGVEADV